MTELRKRINGMFDRYQLRHLTIPIGFDAGLPQEDREEILEDISDMQVEGLDTLNETPNSLTVEIIAGQIISVEVDDHA